MSQVDAEMPGPTIHEAFSSGHRRAQIVTCMFAVGLLLAIAMFVADFCEFNALGRIVHKLPVDKREVQIILYRVFVLSVAWTVFYIATAVAFLRWIYRAHQNLPSLGATKLEFSPGGAVGWYFFPLMNLFKPYQAMRELYAGSDPSVQNQDQLGQRLQAHPLVKSWWIFFLLMGLAGRATSVGRGEDALSMQISAGASITFDALAVIAILFAVTLVRAIDSRQSARASMIALT
jgi:hypothetical protein